MKFEFYKSVLLKFSYFTRQCEKQMHYHLPDDRKAIVKSKFQCIC